MRMKAVWLVVVVVVHVGLCFYVYTIGRFVKDSAHKHHMDGWGVCTSMLD